MINPFKQIGDIKKMRDQAMQIQRELQAEEVVVDKNGVHIVISGDQKIKTLESNGRSDKDVMEAVNEAIKKSQEVAAKKLSQMQGGLGGLLGGGA
ncbi:MAG: YbaB/EbfC family nucleoid-associated protein [Candidatus Levybacteria bacterium]|nr:YbaB/EbfC family nucleoid-associated protein [Candidatus Levybacteria bacterium]MDZ4228393.1 YbaB/EbfC family nucleoid-associated protein [Candidatus Levybacteria bacterium]